MRSTVHFVRPSWFTSKWFPTDFSLFGSDCYAINPISGCFISPTIFHLVRRISAKKWENIPIKCINTVGPPRIPILGSYGLMLLLNYNHLYKAIAWLCKYYKTDVLGLYTGSYLTIVTHSYEATKECMNTQNFDGKPALNLALIREPEFKSRGILNLNRRWLSLSWWKTDQKRVYWIF